MITTGANPSRHHATSYSDRMVAISDREGNLISVMAGPNAHSYALAFCDLPELLQELEFAMLEELGTEKPPTPLAAAAARLLLLSRAFHKAC